MSWAHINDLCAFNLCRLSRGNTMIHLNSEKDLIAFFGIKKPQKIISLEFNKSFYQRDHSFSTYLKFSEKLTFLNP